MVSSPHAREWPFSSCRAPLIAVHGCATIPLMFEDIDLTPQKQPKKPRDLSGMSVLELDAYIDALDVEKGRAEAERARKKAYMAGADGLFKKT